jgi:uncharacterized damage-inducible protein DinB
MSIFTNSASRSRDEAKGYTAAILDLLGTRDPMSVLPGTPDAVRTAIARLSDTELSQREAPHKWSIRHVVRHLADGDLVWGYRLRLVLAQDRPTLTGYDQDMWADRLGYSDADVGQAMDDFTILRRSNLRLIDAASAADLQRVGVHSERGEESVAHMIRMYAGHDLLHLAQIERIRNVVHT